MYVLVAEQEVLRGTKIKLHLETSNHHKTLSIQGKTKSFDAIKDCRDVYLINWIQQHVCVMFTRFSKPV